MRLLRPAWTPGAALDQQIEDARREIHRSGDQPSEVEVGLVLGRIAALATPRVVLLTARSFPAHHVRISPTLTGVVDRLVDVEHDFILCRRLDHLAVVIHHELRVVRITFRRGVSHVPGLDRVETQRVVERECGLHLLLVVLDSARCLVVHDQLDAFRVRVGSQPWKVVVGVRLRERERVSVLNPVAVPAGIPAFHQNATKTVCRGEVDVSLGVLRGGAMLRPGAPGHGVDVHSPPDADVLHWLDPAHVAQHVGRIEIEPEHRWREVSGAIG